MTRRMAVHFWPALTVISCATDLMNRSNSAEPGCAPAPRMEQFNESASRLNGMLLAPMLGCVFNLRPVAAERRDPQTDQLRALRQREAAGERV